MSRFMIAIFFAIAPVVAPALLTRFLQAATSLKPMNCVPSSIKTLLLSHNCLFRVASIVLPSPEKAAADEQSSATPGWSSSRSRLAVLF